MLKTDDSITLAVRFAETDAMGVVHHSNYLIWLEAARVAWLAAAGVPYTEVAAGGHHFAVTAVNLEYRRPARFGDSVQIRTELTLLRSRQVHFAYDVLRVADGVLLARGRTEHICVNLAGTMTTIPEHVIERLRSAIEAVA